MFKFQQHLDSWGRISQKSVDFKLFICGHLCFKTSLYLFTYLVLISCLEYTIPTLQIMITLRHSMIKQQLWCCVIPKFVYNYNINVADVSEDHHNKSGWCRCWQHSTCYSHVYCVTVFAVWFYRIQMALLVCCLMVQRLRSQCCLWNIPVLWRLPVEQTILFVCLKMVEFILLVS